MMTPHLRRKDFCGSRYWIAETAAGAVAISAAILAGDAPHQDGEITGPDGVRLVPATIDVHLPDERQPDACVVLRDSPPCWSYTVGPARPVLEEWVTAGHDDQVLADALRAEHTEAVAR